MLKAFVDESERDESHYFLGALVLTPSQAEQLRGELDNLMSCFAEEFMQLSPHEEFHGSSIMRAAEEPWRSLPKRVAFELYKKALEIIEKSGARYFLEGIDRKRHLARDYQHYFDSRQLAFSYLLERLNGASTNQYPKVQIIADEHHTSEVSRSNFSRYQQVGTFGYRSSKLPNVHSQIEFIASHSDRALQASDLVTYLFNRVTTVVETDARTENLKNKLWDIISVASVHPRGRTRIWP